MILAGYFLFISFNFFNQGQNSFIFRSDRNED